MGIILTKGKPIKKANMTKINTIAIVFDILKAISELTMGVKAKDKIYARESGIEILGKPKTNRQKTGS